MLLLSKPWLSSSETRVSREHRQCLHSSAPADDSSPSHHQHCNPVTKGHQTGQAGFALSEAMLAFTRHILISPVSWLSLQDLLPDLAQHQRNTDQAAFSQVLLQFPHPAFDKTYRQCSRHTPHPQFKNLQGKHSAKAACNREDEI